MKFLSSKRSTRSTIRSVSSKKQKSLRKKTDRDDDDYTLLIQFLKIILLLAVIIGAVYLVYWAITKNKKKTKTPTLRPIITPRTMTTPTPHPTTTPPPLILSDKDATINVLNNQLMIVRSQLNDCTNALKNTPVPKPDVSGQLLAEIPCPIVPSVDVLLALSGASKLGVVDTRMATLINTCKVMDSVGTSPPVGNETLLSVCFDSSDADVGLQNFLATDATISNKLAWFSAIPGANPCTTGTLAPKSTALPITVTPSPPQVVFYLPFTITADDLTMYGNNAWYFFFVADATATLYINNTTITTVYRNDMVSNVGGSFVDVESFYDGSTTAQWKPMVAGDYVLTVSVSSFVPAWRFGFSLCAFQVKGSTRRPVFAHESRRFASSPQPMLIGTILETATIPKKWYYSNCPNAA